MAEVTAFLDDKIIASGERDELARRIGDRYAPVDWAAIRVFENEGGRIVDLDYGSPRSSPAAGEESASRDEEAPSRPRGRPRLGVTAREVTLLPRHWEWLAAQPGGTSAVLRRLIEEARKRPPDSGAARDAAYRFMQTMCGDRPGYEEALRALYRGETERFRSLVSAWPEDVRAYLGRLLG